MGFLATIFGAEKAVDNIIDRDNGLLTQMGGWVGNQQYTEQEAATDKTRRFELYLRMLDSIEPFKVVQRILAFTAAFVFISFSIALIFAWGIDTYIAIKYTINVVGEVPVITFKAVDSLWKIATSNFITYPIVSVFTLYCGGGFLSSMKAKPKAPK